VGPAKVLRQALTQEYLSAIKNTVRDQTEDMGRHINGERLRSSLIWAASRGINSHFLSFIPTYITSLRTPISTLDISQKLDLSRTECGNLAWARDLASSYHVLSLQLNILESIEYLLGPYTPTVP
jgi:hypothetical protein